MPVLKILHYPDQRLRQIAQPVTDFGPSLQHIIDDMYETMYASNGLGLAATQVGINLQLAVMDFSSRGQEKICLINPQVIASDGWQYDNYGCLSLPGYPGINLKRAANIKIQAQDNNAQPFVLEASDDLAICIQHEMDHLVGKLYIDYLSPLKQSMLHKKITKLHHRT
jgi:peptide deformylase